MVLDWTANNNVSTPYFLAEMTNGTFTQGSYASEFSWKTGGVFIGNIECNNDVNCFPVYKFSDNPQELKDLDFSKLVQVKNKSGEDWHKYLVFSLHHSKSKCTYYCNEDTYNKPTFWKSTYTNNKNSFPIDANSGRVLKLELLINGVVIEPELKIINFLTPSFDLEKAIKHQ